MSDLERFISAIQLLHRGTQRGRKKPHKLLLLLAVIDRFTEGGLSQNRIPYNDALIEGFRHAFDIYATQQDWAQPSLPYFHLRTSDFWHHAVIPGREREYAALTTSGGGSKRILDNIAYAYFSDYAWAVLQDAAARRQVRDTIIASLRAD